MDRIPKDLCKTHALRPGARSEGHAYGMRSRAHGSNPVSTIAWPAATSSHALASRQMDQATFGGMSVAGESRKSLIFLNWADD